MTSTSIVESEINECVGALTTRHAFSIPAECPRSSGLHRHGEFRSKRPFMRSQSHPQPSWATRPRKMPDLQQRIRYFCSGCIVLSSQLEGRIPRVRLPAKIKVIKHRQELNSKSTSIQAKFLAPNDVEMIEYSHDRIAGTSSRAIR